MKISPSAINRRRFLKWVTILIAASQLPIVGCKKLFRKKEELTITPAEEEILSHVLQHLFPPDDGIPGATELNTTRFVLWTFYDRNTLLKDKKLIKNGIKWAEESAEKLYSQPFTQLNEEQKEKVLRYMEGFRKGKSWISFMLTLISESLLGDPVYQINTGEKGWKWLNHIPGYPRPGENNKYEAS